MAASKSSAKSKLKTLKSTSTDIKSLVDLTEETKSKNLMCFMLVLLKNH